MQKKHILLNCDKQTIKPSKEERQLAIPNQDDRNLKEVFFHFLSNFSKTTAQL